LSPFEHTPSQRIITSTLAWTLLAATAVVVLMLISSASELSHATGTVVGPLHLFAFSKTPLSGGGAEVSMAVLPGLAVYAAVAVVLAGLISILRLRDK
jgi:hypothetical protein